MTAVAHYLEPIYRRHVKVIDKRNRVMHDWGKTLELGVATERNEGFMKTLPLELYGYGG